MVRDDAWFERFYERHQRAVSAYCLRRVGAADAADATAQVFAVAWRRSSDIPEGEGAVRWLYGVARRVVSHQWRGAGRARRLAEKAGALPAVPAPGPDVVAASRAEHRLVRQAVMRLGENDREVLLLSAWEGLNHAEIAEVVGCSLAAADKRVARARTRLARQYESLAGSNHGADVEETPMKRSPVRARKGGGDV